MGYVVQATMPGASESTCAAPPAASLSRHEVHVWRVPLSASSSHASAREILAGYAGLSPRDLEFTFGSHGKSVLANENVKARGLDFSVSHSGDVAVVAVSVGGPLGIDVERVARPLLTQGVIERCFTAMEIAALCGLPARERHVATLRLWTAKEAYLKALGVGISVPLAGIDVAAVVSGEAASVTWGEVGSGLNRRFWVHALPLGPRHVAAVATPVARPCVTVRDWALDLSP